VRVAWVLYGGLDQRTGGTIYDAQVVTGLRAAGDDVQVVSVQPGDEDLAERLTAIDADVVVGDELCFRELGAAFASLRSNESRRVELVMLVHHLTAWETELALARRAAVRTEEQAALVASDWVITTSATTRARLLAEGVSGRVEVVLPGSDRLELAPRSAEARQNQGAPRFLFLGSVVERKRVLPLVRAFGAVPTGQLVIMGSTTRDEAYVSAVQRGVIASGAADRVTLTGEADEGAVSRALASTDVLVMPSTLEGYGIAATEAIRAGVPVIAARAQGLEEALAPCPDACLFADDDASLASALQRFATTPSLRESLTVAARAASPRMPTWSSCVTTFRALLAR
jgi:glycosyltransferase involved in cell wall biosynthesis